jgi:hypothetical protein
MEIPEHLHHLMAEIGPLLDLGEVQAFEQQGMWTLAVDEHTVLEADYDAVFEKLVIATSVGSPPAEVRPRLYPLLLQYNYLWETTGGARLALDGPEGEVVLACDVPTANLDLPRFQTVVSHMAEQAHKWREIIQTFNEKPEAAEEMAAGIRV